MLSQDTLTGMLHEVPEVAGYGYYGEPAETMGEVYDGFGNPVGFLPFLAPLAAKLLPGRRSPRRFPVSGNSSTDSCLAAARLLPRRPCKPCNRAFRRAFPGLPGLPRRPGSRRSRIPGHGLSAADSWTVTAGMDASARAVHGLAPRRRYMRCVSWPGPPGLVPTSAAMTPQPAQAAVVAAATAPFPRRPIPPQALTGANMSRGADSGLSSDSRPARATHALRRLRSRASAVRALPRFRTAMLLRQRCERRIPDVLVKLGRLRGLIYTSDKGRCGQPRTYVHFMKTMPTLACDPAGRQLHILGGRYRVTARGIEG